MCIFFLLITYVFPIFYKWEKLHAGHAFNDTAREIDWIPFLDHLMSIMLLSTFDGRTCMYVCVCVQCAHLYIVQQHSGMYDILCDYVIERNEWIPSRRPWSSSFLIQSRHQRINRFWIPHVNVYMFVSPSQFSRMHALNIDNNVIWQKYYIFLKSHVSPLPDYYQKQVALFFLLKE